MHVKLTSLSLQGFKSFGDRTVIEFDPGITAVVGPNGSGKSNLIDALKWASGGGRAQSFRAEGKTDLIFHGSRAKRSVSFAEVGLELETPSRRLKIARNLYRDGQTRLRLNGKNARFIDIDEALAGSGLGRNALAIIGQGEVGHVLMADPEKLLGYVAEVAGVSKLSIRRAQSQQRLDQAKEHLQRLLDILYELEAQIASLEVEAEQADRAGKLTQEKVLLNYSLSWLRVDTLGKEQSKLQDEESSVSKQLAEGNTQLERNEKQWQHLRQEVLTIEEQYRYKLTDYESKRGDLRVAEEKLVAAQGLLKQLEQDKVQVSSDRNALKQQRAPQPPTENLDQLLEKRAQLAQSFELAEQERVQYEKDYQALVQQVQQSHAQSVQYERDLKQYQQRSASLEREQNQLQERLSAFRPQLNAEITSMSEQLEDYQAKQLQLSSELEALQEALILAQQASAQQMAEVDARTREAKRLKAAYEARSGYAQGSRNALQSGISGIIGPVADLITVPKDYQVALSAALGRRAEYIVVSNSQVGQHVIGFVKQHGGMVTLLPLDTVKARKSVLPSFMSDEDGVVGSALSLLQVDDLILPVMSQLLGTTTIVDTLAQAVTIAKRHSKRPRIVTREGEIIESYGAMTGGRPARRSIILGAAKEVEDAEVEAKHARERAELSQRHVRELQEQYRRQQQALRELDSHRERHALLLQEKRQRFAAEQSLQQELQERLKQIAEQQSALQTPEALGVTHDLDNDALQHAEQQWRHSAKQVARQQDDINTLERQLATLRAELKAYEDATARYQADQERMLAFEAREGSLKQKISTLTSELQELEKQRLFAAASVPDDVTRIAKQLQDQQAALAETEKSLSQLSQQQASGAETLAQVRLSLARRETALELAREELQQFPAGLQRIDASARTLRQRLNACEQALGAIGAVNQRAQQELKEQRDRYAHLAAQREESQQAVEQLEVVLADIDRETNKRLNHSLNSLAQSFARHVQTLFGADAYGGLVVQREDGRPEGLQIELQPAGKQTRSLNLLSVGERTMGAMAFLFALMAGDEQQGLPLAILDEVDAPLDEANIRRFCDFLTRLAKAGTQFVLISHQKATMEVADMLWGVTTEGGVSRVFSIHKDEALSH